MLRLRFTYFWLSIGLVLTALTVSASFMPNFSPPIYFEGMDKVGHFFAYMVVTFWFSQIYRRNDLRWAIGLVLVALGMGLEYLQLMTGSHIFEYADILANTAGVLCALLLAQTRFSRGLVLIERKLLYGT